MLCMRATWTIHGLENVLTWKQDGKQAKHQLSRTSELGVTSKRTQELEQLQLMQLMLWPAIASAFFACCLPSTQLKDILNTTSSHDKSPSRLVVNKGAAVCLTGMGNLFVIKVMICRHTC